MLMPKGGQGMLSGNLYTTILGARIAPLASLVGLYTTEKNLTSTTRACHGGGRGVSLEVV